MKLRTENLAKKFVKTWIFRNLNLEIQSGELFALTGPNGSGKSTLLQILSGYLSPTEGELFVDDKPYDPEQFLAIGFSAPYVEIPEEFTFLEFLEFHSTFRKRRISVQEISKRTLLPLDRTINDFSTGMKQRVQLSTIFYFDNQLIFMDEPTANLDEAGYQWWKRELETIEATTILASNQAREIGVCDQHIQLLPS